MKRITNLKKRYLELGFPGVLSFYLSNLFFGEQGLFNSFSLISFLVKQQKWDKFFKGDRSFWGKINVEIEYLYNKCQKGKIKFLNHDKLNEKLYFSYKGYKLVTDYSVGILLQIFSLESYKFDWSLLKSDTGYCVFDIGMNKGFSSLWYAIRPEVEKVIGYEINPLLLPYIEENAKMNEKISAKIKVNMFGLADKDSKVEFFSLKNDDGVGTMNEEFYMTYWSPERKKNVKKVLCTIKRASVEILKEMKNCPSKKYLMKIDVEGAEYSILEDLYKENVIQKFDFVMGEAHDGLEGIKKYMNDFEFLEINELPGKLTTFIARRKC